MQKRSSKQIPSLLGGGGGRGARLGRGGKGHYKERRENRANSFGAVVRLGRWFLAPRAHVTREVGTGKGGVDTGGVVAGGRPGHHFSQGRLPMILGQKRKGKN